MPHLLFVCTANICRSPLAEGYFRNRLQELELDDWSVSSAGTWAEQVRGASRYSVEVMADRGIQIDSHQARMINETILADADLVLTMESGHAEALRAEFPGQAYKVHLLSAMAGPEYNISDPYGGPRTEYEMMARDVIRLIDEGWEQIMALGDRAAAS
jgi:protein-tyrosine-phosphatase